MMNSQKLGNALQRLREEARLSQTEVAKKLSFTASRLSRVESGELSLSNDEAQELALAIGSDAGKAFAEYLNKSWAVLEPPGYDHVSMPALWTAEQALRKLDDLKDDPDLKNAFLKQVDSCRQALEREAKFLLSKDHSIAFIGKPNVGKTTAICALSDLRDSTEKDLSRQMGLQTGGGRTTTCEVHIRCGGEYSIVVEPISDEELRQHVSEFCDQLLALAKESTGEGSKEGGNNSAEAERALRNMADLPTRRIREADGSFRVEDKGIDLARAYPSRQDLQVQVFARLNMPQRRLTSVAYSPSSPTTELKWLSKIFAEINFGRHPDFPLPRRIEISVPSPILRTNSLNLRLVDTRGIDEPSVPRRDLQAFLDDERTVVVLCSGFGDAPDAATLTFIERAKETGALRALLERGVFVVVPKGAEEKTLLNDETGEPVGDIEEGRLIRYAQVQATAFTGLGVRSLPIEFLDANSEQDCDHVRRSLAAVVGDIRKRAEQKVLALAETVDQMISNKADLQVQAVYAQALRPLRVWLKGNQVLVPDNQPIQAGLLSGIRGLRYASSLRASVNRFGSWIKFDYWYTLGAGKRRDTFVRTTKQMADLRALITNALNDEGLADSHGFLKHFLNQVEKALSTYLVEVQQIAEAAFGEELREDRDYWEKCQERWGLRLPYKEFIADYTNHWFEAEGREARHTFVESEIQRRWACVLTDLSEQLNVVGSAAE